MEMTRGLAVAALLAFGTAQAQLKPPSTGIPPLMPGATTPAAPVVSEAAMLKQSAGRAAAEKWLALLDNRDYGTAWDECATTFRERVTRQQWVEGLPNNRGVFGATVSRKVEDSSFKTSLPGMPNGEYVTVLFGTRFEKKDGAQELVTLVYESGAWRPLGYGVR